MSRNARSLRGAAKATVSIGFGMPVLAKSRDPVTIRLFAESHGGRTASAARLSHTEHAAEMGRCSLLLLLSLGATATAYMGAALSAPARRFAPRQSAPGMMGEETPMERAARERAEDAAKRARIEALRTPKMERRTMFGLDAPQACESSFDCEQPLVCCDLLFTSVCCAGGMMIPRVDPAVQYQAIPIPVERDRPGTQPPAPGPQPPTGF